MNLMAKRLVKQLQMGDLFIPGSNLEEVNSDDIFFIEEISNILIEDESKDKFEFTSEYVDLSKDDIRDDK